MTASNVRDACPASTLTTQTLRVAEELTRAGLVPGTRKRVRAAAQSSSATGTAGRTSSSGSLPGEGAPPLQRATLAIDPDAWGLPPLNPMQP